MKKACFSAILAYLWPVLSLSAGPQSTLAQAPATPPRSQAPSAAGQAQSTVPPPQPVPTGIGAFGGSIANDVYTNSMYGFSLHVPPGWVVVPVAAPATPATNGAPENHMQTFHPVLIVIENSPLKKPYERKSIQVLATHMRVEPSATSAEDYLVYSQKTAKENAMGVTYEESPRPMTINGQSFTKAEMQLSINGGEQHVEQYVTTEEQNLLQFMLVSPNEAGLKDREPSIQSVRFQSVSPKTTSRTNQAKTTSAKPAPRP